MAKQELQLFNALKDIFPEESWSWAIPSLRRTSQIWGKLGADGFLQFLVQEIGKEPTNWTPGRIAAMELNRETSHEVIWPIRSFSDLSAELRHQVYKTYQEYGNSTDQLLDLDQAFLLTLALLGERSSGKTWQEIINQLSPLTSWISPLTFLFNCVEEQQEFIQALNPDPGMQILFSTPLDPAARVEFLSRILSPMDASSQEIWLKALLKEVPELAPKVARVLLIEHKPEPSNIQESVTLSLLNQLAGNTEAALNLLKEASDQNQKLHGKLAANLNKVRNDLQQPEVNDETWQELTAAIGKPSSLDENVGEIADIIRSLLDNKYYEAAGDLIDKLQDPLPEHPELLSALAEYALSQNQKTRAGQLALLALERTDQVNTPPANLSSILLQADLPEESVQASELYLAKHPNHLPTHYTYAEALSRTGDYSSAAKQAQIASVLNPQDLRLHRELANYLEQAESWKEALEVRSGILSKLQSLKEAKSHPEPYLPEGDLLSFAGCALAAQQGKRAVTACNQILEQDPDNSKAHAIKGKSLISLEHQNEGFAHINRAIELSPNLEDPWIALAECQLESNAPDQAIQTLKSAATAASTHARVFLKLGQIQSINNHQSEALESFQNASAASEVDIIDPKTNFEIQYGLGYSYYRLGHHEQARTTLKDLQKRYPANGKTNSIYGKLLLDMDEPLEALPYLAQVVDQKPPAVDPYLQYADAHLRIGTNPKAAAEVLEQALLIDPENEIAFVLLGEAHAAEGDYQQAITSFQKVQDTSLRTDPAWSPRISRGLGISALELGQTETAIASLKEGNEQYPRDLALIRSLAEAYQAANLTPNALDSAKRATEVAPHDVENLSWVAEFTLSLGTPEHGISALKELIRIKPDHHTAYILLGKAHASAGNEKEASASLARVLKFDDILPEELIQAGEELIKLGNLDTGMKCLLKAANICEANPAPSPLLPKIWSHLAAGQEMNGDPKKALDLLDQAISAELDQPSWRIQKADLLLRQDRFQAAIASLSNALDLCPDDPELHAKIARVQQQVSSYEEAFYHAQEALVGFQSEPTYRIEKYAEALKFAADLASATLKNDQAESILSNLVLDQLQNDKKHLQAHLHSLCLMGEIALNQNQEVKAAEISNLLISQEFDHPRVSALQARILNRQGCQEEARERFEQATETWHKQPAGKKSFSTAVEIAFGVTAQELHQWDEAVTHIQHAADLNPTEKRVVYELAQAYVKRAEARRFSEALKAICRAPDQRALSNEVSESFQECIQVLQQLEIDPQIVGNLKTRGEAVFSPNQETAEKLKAVAETPEELAALIAAYQHCRQKVIASQSALDALTYLGENAFLDAQIALALLKTKPETSFKAACSALEVAKKSNTSQIPLYFVLHSLAAKQIDDLLSAEESIQKALQIWDNEPRWHALAAEMSLDYSEAVSLYHQAIDLEPNFSGHYLALGKLHLKSNQPLPAIKSFEKAISINPDFIDAWIHLSLSKRAVHRMPEALASINQALSLAPDHKETRKTAALLTFENGSYRQSENHLVSLLGQDPHDTDLLALFARTLSAQKQPEQALRVIDKAISLEEDTLNLRLQRAGMIKEMSGLQAAIDELRIIGSHYPDQFPLVLELVSTLAEAGEVDQAVQTAQEVLQNDEIGYTRNQKAHLHLFAGRLLRKTGQLDQAVHHLHKAKKLVDPNYEAAIELGRVHHDRRQYELALDQISKAIEIEPQEPEGYYQAGRILKELKQFDRAERMLRKASKLAPHDLKIHRQLGVLVTLNLVHGEPKKEPMVT
ncbi:MAG: tetratricopeptide repeat protein [Anaerolineales bacterium]|nr:tetratricopeptide repeat protein [Anaerolineales bacterium]